MDVKLQALAEAVESFAYLANVDIAALSAMLDSLPASIWVSPSFLRMRRISVCLCARACAINASPASP
jgi:hypothetical protein